MGKLILKKGADPSSVKRVINPKLYKRIPKKRIFRWKWSQPYLKRNSRRYKRVFPSRRPLLKKKPLVLSKSVHSYSAKPNVSVGHAYDRFRPMKKPKLELKDRMSFRPIAHPVRKNPNALDFKLKKPAELKTDMTIF